MEFEVLGRLAARRDGVDLALGSFKQRSLLALLLIHANEVVATDRIIDELWGDQPVGDRQNALWVHVSNLRSALEPTREKRSEGTLLLTRSPGYLLQVDPDELDEWRFERSVHEGRALLDTDPARRRSCSARAWRCGVVGRTRMSLTSRSPSPRSGGSRSFASRPWACASTPICAGACPPSSLVSSKASSASIPSERDSPRN